MKISASIVTWNEEENISVAINSIKPYVDEVVVVDMGTDKTSEIAKKLGARVYKHNYTGYVEPARNFAIEKTIGDWIFILDADEEVPPALGKKLKYLSQTRSDYFEIPRKNIVFGKWLRHSRWWPDYLIRFFKKGTLSWPEEIHLQPKPEGAGEKLEPTEDNAIIHHHYQSISQYLERLNRYTDQHLKRLKKDNYKFMWTDLIEKPTNEFLSRFYYGQGFKDGIHGLALSLLQASSELVLYLKMWESEKFTDNSDAKFKQGVEKEIRKSVVDWYYWVGKTGNFTQRLKSRLINLIT